MNETVFNVLISMACNNGLCEIYLQGQLHSEDMITLVLTIRYVLGFAPLYIDVWYEIIPVIQDA